MVEIADRHKTGGVKKEADLSWRETTVQLALDDVLAEAFDVDTGGCKAASSQRRLDECGLKRRAVDQARPKIYIQRYYKELKAWDVNIITAPRRQKYQRD